MQPDFTWPAFAELGSTLLDRYEVLGRFRGGFGIVLHVEEQGTRHPYAVKLPKLTAPLPVDQFKSEVDFWLNLPPHPNIVQANFVSEIAGRPALFMEYVAGTPYNSLAKWLDVEPIPEGSAFQLAQHLCLAMEFANRRTEIAHRDLKPENVLIGGECSLKLTDFGSAVQVAVKDGAYPQVTSGSWPYAAPEMLRREVADTRSDIYSFGMITFQMLTRRLPFPFDLETNRDNWYHQLAGFYSSKEFRYSYGLGRSIPECSNIRMADILANCLAPEPASRPRDFATLLNMVNTALGLTPVAGPDHLLTREHLFDVAVNLRRLGKYEEALSKLNLLLAKNPNHPNRSEILLEIAENYKLTGSPGVARSFERQARGVSKS